ncbi:MAG TPA: 3-oxoacyl-ACP reductase FabG [Myxococcota bacterium]|jgi:2-hydroxycyclohexanecarboxyl-CoA dehydrogenase
MDARVAMVTGAARGIGAAIAQKLAEHGFAVGACDIDASGAAERARAITGAGGRALGVGLDVTSMASVAAGVEQIEATLGAIDVLVNNAGIDVPAFFLESREEDWERLIAVNLRGVLHCTKRALVGMTERRRGRVINIASDAGRVGAGGEAVYSATKGAVIAFTKALAREMARLDITVNAVCPGATDTALLALLGEFNPKLHSGLVRSIPLRRVGQPADVAGAVAFLAGDDAAYITGQSLSVSGGLTML